MPDVAFVEFPPKKAGLLVYAGLGDRLVRQITALTLLVENDDVAAGEVDGMRGTEAGHCVVSLDRVV
jgi:hypothetical protein